LRQQRAQGLLRLRSAELGREERVAVRVAEEAQRRHGVSHTAHLRVDVDPESRELGVERVDVVGRDADAGGGAGRVARARWNDRERRRRARRRDLDPALALGAEDDVGTLLEAERVDVERERPLLV
jgi:hypothetical protein